MKVQTTDMAIRSCCVPEGAQGDWSVKRFIVEDNEVGKLRALYNLSAMGRWTPPGEYTGLYRRGAIIMSDTPDELRDLRPILKHARGKVLIGGLGLGIVVGLLLEKEGVKEITVVEIDQDVIDLVGLHYLAIATWRGISLKIVCADFFSWVPPRGICYDAVWLDIWSDICADNVSEMEKLIERFRQYSSWIGAWCQYEMYEAAQRYGSR